jgi:hypothetical protein
MTKEECVPHLTMSDGTARIPSIHHNSAADWLNLSEVIQNNTLILSVFVPLDGVRLCRDVFGSVVPAFASLHLWRWRLPL